jgi:acyl-lipid omega-6 desaturase (Delta-12 desaturase)
LGGHGADDIFSYMNAIATAGSTGPVPSAATWKGIVERFQEPSAARASWQLINTLVPYAALWYAMYRCMAVSYWLVLPMALLAAGLLVRVFIVFHDCGHGSFFKSKMANNITGFVAGMLTLTPYYHWRWEHALHHGSSGQLDRRGAGDDLRTAWRAIRSYYL